MKKIKCVLYTWLVYLQMVYCNFNLNKCCPIGEQLEPEFEGCQEHSTELQENWIASELLSKLPHSVNTTFPQSGSTPCDSFEVLR